MKSILVVADPLNRKQHALDHAVSLAKKTGVHIVVVSFRHETLAMLSPYEEEAKEIQQKLDEHCKNWWKNYVKENLPEDITIAVECVWEKDIHPWVIKKTENNAFDLVIKTGNRSEAAFYTPTDWYLFRDSHAPVYIVNADDLPRKKVVLASLDMGTSVEQKQELNSRILEVAFRLAVQIGGDLHCAHVVRVPALVKELSFPNTPIKVAQERELVLERLASLLDVFDVARENVHICEGDPGKEISSLAENLQVECVVIGCLGRKGVASKFIGNTAEKVIQHVKSDLLVVNHLNKQ